MENLEVSLSEIKNQLREIRTALSGDKITNSGGIVRRLDDVEERLDAVEKKSHAQGIYVKIMWASVGGVAMAIFALFINNIHK